MTVSFERIDSETFDARLIEFRRDIHRHPELGWTEYRTTVKVIEALEASGIQTLYGPELHKPEYMFGMPDAAYLRQCEQRAAEETGRADLIEKMKGGFTGCIGMIKGNNPGPTVAFRVDIDGLEVEESSDQEHFPTKEGFRSLYPSLMHACGHDGHVAIGVGAAEILAKYRDNLHGNVIMIFQPAEEGVRGALSMTQAGILPRVDYIFSGHIGVKLKKFGIVAAGTHGFLASTKLNVSFKGKSAHAAVSPELGHNALAAAATAVVNMLAIPRHSGGTTRINIGTLNAGTNGSIIPDKAEMSVQTRGDNSELNQYMVDKAERVCKAAADMYECRCESKYMGGVGSAECDRDFVKFIHNSVQDMDGVTEVIDDIVFGGGEDFTYMMKEVQTQGGKATEMMLGAEMAGTHHNDRFDFNEKVIGLGARIFAKIILDLGR